MSSAADIRETVRFLPPDPSAYELVNILKHFKDSFSDRVAKMSLQELKKTVPPEARLFCFLFAGIRHLKLTKSSHTLDSSLPGRLASTVEHLVRDLWDCLVLSPKPDCYTVRPCIPFCTFAVAQLCVCSLPDISMHPQ